MLKLLCGCPGGLYLKMHTLLILKHYSKLPLDVTKAQSSFNLFQLAFEEILAWEVVRHFSEECRNRKDRGLQDNKFWGITMQVLFKELLYEDKGKFRLACSLRRQNKEAILEINGSCFRIIPPLFQLLYLRSVTQHLRVYALTSQVHPHCLPLTSALIIHCQL